MQILQVTGTIDPPMIQFRVILELVTLFVMQVAPLHGHLSYNLSLH